jgi:hypothetical protein
MAEKERITNPSMGSNELGAETNEEVSTGISAGTDTQLKLAALSGRKRKKDKNTNDDEVSETSESESLSSDDTDE